MLQAVGVNASGLFIVLPLPDAAKINKSTVPQYPTNDTYTNPNDFIQKLKDDATKIGSSIVLRVIAGDKVNIHASSWWTNNNVAANPANTISPLTDIVTSLISTVPAASGGKVVTGQLTSTILNPSVTDLLNNRNSNNYATAKPKAYLNWILLDDQFNEVLTNDGKNSGFEQVGADGVFTQHNKTAVEMTKNGYLYVYVSNESTDINVFFDNLQVTQVRGRVLEETHYYPFGLTMAGISSKAASKLENKFKYNGIEKIADFDLEDYDAQYRELDPQIGRWWEVDPKVDNMEAWSPYASNYDNPVIYKDPLGDAPGDPDDEAPHTEHFHAATRNEYKESPWRALAVDAGWFLANLTGATAVDDAVTTFKDKNASTSDKVLAILNVGFATARGGEGPGAGKIKTGSLPENFGGENNLNVGTYKELKEVKANDAHHIIQDAAAKELPGYSRDNAPAVQLEGPSTKVGSPHYNATQVQRQSGGGSYAAERRIGYKALRKAGLSESQARELIKLADNYFIPLGVTGETNMRIPGNRKK